MLVVGPISSVYDFLTFGVLLFVFNASESTFQSGWFVESLVTQTLVLFVIRTADLPWKNKPSRPLLLAVVGVVSLGLALPYSGLGTLVGLVPLPPLFLVYVLVASLSYLAIVQAIKRRVLTRLLG
jgi:Mg2+-importing ATPase